MYTSLKNMRGTMNKKAILLAIALALTVAARSDPGQG